MRDWPFKLQLAAGTSPSSETDSGPRLIVPIRWSAMLGQFMAGLLTWVSWPALLSRWSSSNNHL